MAIVELNRQKIAEWGDPLTPPQSRTDCIGYASGDWPWGGGWKTCNEWKTSWRHMEVEIYLAVNGPADLGAEAKKAVISCTAIAAAAAIGAGVSGNEEAASAAAKVAFMACMAQKGVDVTDEYSLSVLPPITHWTDWS